MHDIPTIIDTQEEIKSVIESFGYLCIDDPDTLQLTSLTFADGGDPDSLIRIVVNFHLDSRVNDDMIYLAKISSTCDLSHIQPSMTLDELDVFSTKLEKVYNILTALSEFEGSMVMLIGGDANVI